MEARGMPGDDDAGAGAGLGVGASVSSSMHVPDSFHRSDEIEHRLIRSRPWRRWQQLDKARSAALILLEAALARTLNESAVADL